MTIYDQLKRDESFRSKPYLDCCGKYWRDCTCAFKGKLTIGYGRNLDDNGISESEGDYLLENDVGIAIDGLNENNLQAPNEDLTRWFVLVNMTFNMGIDGLLKFHRMLDAYVAGNWQAAASRMRASLWFKQVGKRAERLIKQMETGEWQ